MIRKLNDKHVEIIKVMLNKKYSSKSIIDFMDIEHEIEITASQIGNIKKGMSYFDIRPDLNDSIGCLVKTNKSVEEISFIKWSLAHDYSESDIIKASGISKKELMNIRLLYSPYRGIAVEYNDAIEKKWQGRKKANIDEPMVISIKKEFVSKKGMVTCKEIAEMYNINPVTVSSILNLSVYKELGESYNSRIIDIHEKKEASRKRKSTQKVKVSIAKEKDKNKLLKQEFHLLAIRIKESDRRIINLKESL